MTVQNVKHWEHTEYVDEVTFKKFCNHSTAITPSVELPYNTAVFVSHSDKRVEGVYDKKAKGIRPLIYTGDKKMNRDLRLYKDALENEDITILAVNGLPGTGKTSTCIESLISQHLSKVDVSPKALSNPDFKKNSVDHKILIAKPHVNASGESYGHLPGDIDEKLEPTLSNFIQYFNRWHQGGFYALRDAGYVEVLPLGFIRGLDAKDVTVIVDEAQNTKELITTATRRAPGSKIILMGDTSPFQIDLPGNTPEKNGLKHLIDLLQGASYFQYIEMRTLEHIVRSGEAKDVVRRLFKMHGQNPDKWTV